MTGSTGYMNPMRNMERRLAPDFAQREMRDPGLHSTGLGSLKHTMPHLRRISAGAMRLATGGSPASIAQAIEAARPYRWDPDPQRRQMLQSLQLSTRGTPTAQGFPYADGGGVDDGGDGDNPPVPQDLMQPEDQQSPDEGDERQVVLEAMAALEGQSEDPEEALAHFIDTFGPRALKDLQQMVESKHRQEDQESGDDDDDGDEDAGAERMPLQGGDDEEGGEEDQLAGAGGGLLSGPGTGQSDEIEASTPSGRPVLLSDGEYVFDAPTVAALGDGSTNAGARRLDELRKQIRQNAYGHDKQAKPMRAGGLKL